MLKRLFKYGIVFSLGIGGMYWYITIHKAPALMVHTDVTLPGIDMRDYTQDQEAFVKQMFKDEWYLMFNDPRYDLDFVLKNNAPHTFEPQYFGKMPIKLLYENGQPVGLAAYYMKTEHLGHLLFILVDKSQRGKGYSKKLVHYSEEALKALGAKIIKIDTREENLIAQKLYSGLGYIEKLRDRGYVTFTKQV